MISERIAQNFVRASGAEPNFRVGAMCTPVPGPMSQRCFLCGPRPSVRRPSLPRCASPAPARGACSLQASARLRPALGRQACWPPLTGLLPPHPPRGLLPVHRGGGAAPDPPSPGRADCYGRRPRSGAPNRARWPASQPLPLPHPSLLQNAQAVLCTMPSALHS